MLSELRVFYLVPPIQGGSEDSVHLQILRMLEVVLGVRRRNNGSISPQAVQVSEVVQGIRRGKDDPSNSKVPPNVN